jgi:hypothetical protein
LIICAILVAVTLDKQGGFMAYPYSYREIIKAKAAALAREAEFGSDEQILASMRDLSKFSKECHGVPHLGCAYDEMEAAYQAAERERANASLRLRALAE